MEDSFEIDDAEASGNNEFEHFGQISAWQFRELMDEAVQHAAVTATADPGALPWRSIGPRNIGGRIRALAQHPRFPGILFSGSASGGLWKSTNGGDNWVSLDNFRPPNAAQALPIGAVAVARSDPNRVYVGTGEPPLNTSGRAYKLPGNGLYWSTDGGQTLNQIDPPNNSSEGAGRIGSAHYETIVVDPWESSRLWLASPVTGLWRGRPSGASGSLPVFSFDKTAAAISPGDEQATDVVINFGNETAAGPNGNYTVYLALFKKGIFRAEFNPASNSYIGGWTNITPTVADGRPNPYFRIKLARSRARPDWLYAVFSDTNNKVSRVLISENRGTSWRATSERTGDDGKQARYDLFLAVHPMDANYIYVGSVEIFRSHDGGSHWEKLFGWSEYNKGNRALHADQHAFMVDANDPYTLWLGNDGGVSQSLDLGKSWRKRSYGIVVGQFYDVTVHPKYPWLMGGGLQDNGSWVSYGGQSWYYLYSGDGGLFACDPNNPHQFLCTHQGTSTNKASTSADDRKNGVVRAVMTESSAVIGSEDSPNYLNAMPDVPLKADGKPRHLLSNTSRMTSSFNGAHHGAFVGVIAAHPTKSGHALSGKFKSAYLMTDGTTFNEITAGLGLTEFVTAVAYDPSDADNRYWIGTDNGRIYMTANAGTDWNNRTPAGVGSHRMTAIAVHPANPHIVAFAIAQDASRTAGPDYGQIYLSGNAGDETLAAANRGEWREISGKNAPCLSVAGQEFNPSPTTALVFDPTSPNVAAGPHILYAGSLTGVYVLRNASAPVVAGDSFPPVWHTFNQGLPLVLISDLVISTYKDSANNQRQLLRAASYGRGIYECEIGAGLPPVRLLIRNHIMQDGRNYHADHLMTEDPRLTDTPEGKALRPHESIDIRIESVPYRYFGVHLDGAEIDELVRTEAVKAGEPNIIYIQIHNTGATVADPVQVHLFFADTSGAPSRAPDLPAGFWPGFPAAAAPWRVAGRATLNHLASGQPAVARISWIPPADTGAEIALLAISTHGADNLLNRKPDGTGRNAADPEPPLVVDPRKANSLIEQDRRAALRVTTVEVFSPDPYSRDGVDDQGLGAVAWGGRSADIVVLKASAAAALGDINANLTDLFDHRSDDQLNSTDNYKVFVRVHNRRKLPVANVQVRLFTMQLETIHDPASWVGLGTVNIANIDAQKWRFSPPVDWDKPVDPNTDSSYKVWLIAAVIGMTDPAGPDDEAPDHTTISTVQEFWQFFLEGERSNNATLKAVRWAS